jgi:hypothetical protein
VAFEIVPKSRWGGRPADSCTGQDPDDLLGVTIHHTASPRSASSASGSAALVRGVQNFHMDTSPEDYVDIAYNFLFDKWGQIFQGRGWACRSGANGTSESNRTHLSFCYIGHSDLDGFPQAAQDACAWLLSEAFKKGVGQHVVPHSFWGTGTACPGNKIRNWVASGAWRIPAKQVRYLLLDEGEVVFKSGKVPLSESKERLKTFLARLRSEDVDALHKQLADEGKTGAVKLARKVYS